MDRETRFLEQQSPPLIPPPEFDDDPDIMMEESANDLLDKKKEEIKKKAGFEIRRKLLIGHVPSAIIDFTAKEKVDLIVIGNVGRSGISKIKTLGGVSGDVSERAPCPVMIIHCDCITMDAQFS